MEQNIIDARSLQAKLAAGEPIQVIDVRSSSEYQQGHIPQAINIPMEMVESRLPDLSAHHPVVLVCHSGRRACLTEEWLNAHHDEVIILEGGTQAWAESNLPIVGAMPTAWSLERQVRLAAGVLVLIGTLMSVLIQPNWIYLAMFVGAGLAFAGLTNTCGMAMVLAKAPWNRPKVADSAKAARGAA